MVTPVIFVIGRSKRAAEYGVTAVFPCKDEDNGCMTCYAHIGQHSSCCYEWYFEQRKAKPEEYADLLRELVSIGYDDLKVYSRIQPWMRDVSKRG